MTGAGADVGAFLGGGVGYRRAHRAALLAPAAEAQGGAGAAACPDVLEIMPEHFYARPGDIDALAERYPLMFHCVGLSVGTAGADPAGDETTRAQLPRLRELVRRARPLFVSDHLAFTRSPGGIDLGHLCPLPCSEESYALVAARVRLWQDALEVPIALENIAHPFVWPGKPGGQVGETGEMGEGAFFRRLAAETGCGMLLDVTNLLYDARNFGGAPEALLSELPLDAVWALHLAGGVRAGDRFWTDTHDHPVDEDAFALLPRLRGRAPSLRAAIVERDGRLPALDALCAEARRAADLLRGA